METATHEQRVALLRRLKRHLEEQRSRFQQYLKILEEEKNSIAEGRLEDLEAQITLEENLVREIVAVQKVIVPLQEVYRATQGSDPEVESIQEHLNELARTAAERNRANRMLLSARLEEIRQQMASLRIRPGARYYQGAVGLATRIDVTT